MTQSNFIIRWDDISRFQDRKKFRALVDLFRKHEIPAVLGLIPENQDQSIRFEEQTNSEFIAEITELKEIGWEIALHGYRHLQHNANGGILNLNQMSEFAGRPYDDQLTDIRAGKQVLSEYQFNPVTFIPPWHSYDEVTLKALSETGFKFLSDGLSLYPGLVNGLTQMPLLFWSPPSRMRVLGWLGSTYTICLHPHLLTEEDISRWDHFFETIKPTVTTFEKLIPEIPKLTQSGIIRKVNEAIFNRMFRKA